MPHQMSRFGVGPKIFFLTALFAVLIVFLAKNLSVSIPFFFIQEEVLNVFGAILVIAGAALFLAGAIQLQSGFHKGKLETGGVFAYCRHPAYGAWMTLIIPGISLCLNNIFYLSISIFMYFVFSIFIPREEKYLTNTFGRAHEEYRKNVNRVLPKIRFKKH